MLEFIIDSIGSIGNAFMALILLPFKLIAGLIVLAFVFVITILFVFLPSFFFDPAKTIPDIEKDLCLQISKQYQVKYKDASFLGFDSTYDVKLEFSKYDFNRLVDQAKIASCKRGIWIDQDEDYVFVPDEDLSIENGYSYQARLISQTRILEYMYRDF